MRAERVAEEVEAFLSGVSQRSFRLIDRQPELILSGVVRLITNHLHLTIFKSAPEVGALCYAGHYSASTLLLPRPTPAVTTA